MTINNPITLSCKHLSLKCVKIHGHFVKCQICKRHNAVMRFLGVWACRQCLKPMVMGFMAGKLDRYHTQEEDE